MKFRQGMVFAIGVGWLGVLALVAMSIQPGAVSAQGAPGTPVMMTTSNFMTPPPTVYPPTQVGDGEQVYYNYCMTCHGDRGQGLTDQWRNEIGAPDSNCWSAHCHASNRFESNFSFPKNVPAVVGPEVLAGFSTALNLHDFIQSRMPFQAPGSLTDGEYWSLTAYLMKANGVDPGPGTLDAARAARIRFTQGGGVETVRDPSAWWQWVAVGGVAVILLGAAFTIWRNRRGGAE